MAPWDARRDEVPGGMALLADLADERRGSPVAGKVAGLSVRANPRGQGPSLFPEISRQKGGPQAMRSRRPLKRPGPHRRGPGTGGTQA